MRGRSRLAVPVRGAKLAAAAVGAALLLGAAGRASAALYEGERVVAVESRGSRSIATETILAKVQTKPGNPYKDAVVSEDIRRLFALGYFTDVQVDVERLTDGLKVVFVVKEKPFIESVELQGYRALQKPKLLELLGVAPNELVDPRTIKDGVERIKAEYARKGYSQNAVVWRLEPHEDKNSAVVYVVIDEGPRMRISGILVEGNAAFSDRQIRKVIKTKRRKWLWPGVYDEQVLDEDLERVRIFYRKHGYQDINISSQVYRDPEGKGLVIHLTVEEGLQHRIGAVDVDGNVLFPKRELLGTISLKPGAVYTSDALQYDLQQLKQYYGDRGYINADVAPDPQLDQATKRVNLTYRITEHELVYVHRVDVEGNLQTRDRVVRRELRIYPGEKFDGAKIRKSVDRLNNLGYFEQVDIETRKTDAPQHEDLVIKVKEAKTGAFSFGGGFSSVDKLVGLVELEQRNFSWRNWPSFTGDGQDLQFSTQIGSSRRFFDLSFTEPWMLGYPVSFGLDGYVRTRLRSSSSGFGFDEERRGGGVRLGKEFWDLVKVSANYQFYRTDISDVADEASADLRAEQGVTNISVGSLMFAIDGRNNRFDPTKGYYAFISGDLAGGIFAADRDFWRLQGGASYYWPHLDKLVLELRTRAGWVDAYGDSREVPIFERFFGGGSGTIRGYRERRVGPVDESSNDPIGGEATFLGTAEEVLTIVQDERGQAILKGAAFFDVGNVWRRVDDFGESYKASVGIGARVRTPIGPIRLDVGFPLSDLRGEDRKPRFHFNVSRSF